MGRRISFLLLVAFILIFGLIGCGASSPNGTDSVVENPAGVDRIKMPTPDGEYLLKKETHFNEKGEPRSTYESYYDPLGKKTFQMYLFYNDQEMKENFAHSGESIPDSWGYVLAYDYNNGEYPTRSRIVQGTTLTGEAMSYGYTLYTYDHHGNLIETKDYNATDSLTFFTTLQYDDNHNCVREEMYNDDYELLQFVTNVYNSDGLNISGESGKAPNIATHKYEYEKDKTGNIVRSNYLNGKYDGCTIYEYDSHGNLIRMTSEDTTGAIIGWNEYEYISLSDHLAQTQPSLPSDKDDQLEAFCNMIDGVWVDVNSCKPFGPDDAMFTFYEFTDGGMYWAAYPGGADPVGEIVDVIVNPNNQYTITTYYPAMEWMGTYYDEEYVEGSLQINGDTFFFTNYPETVYSYMGKNLDSAKKAVVEYCNGNGSIQTGTEGSDLPRENTYAAPYCPGNFSKIGEAFSSFHVAGSGLQYSSSSLYILMVQEYPLIRNGWDAYTDYNGYASRVGVANDRIVFNIQDLASGVSVAESLPSDMLGIEPLIIYGVDDYGSVDELMLIWKGDNGYMVGFTTAYGYPNGSYQDEQVKFFISTVDLSYISNMPVEAIAANPAF